MHNLLFLTTVTNVNKWNRIRQYLNNKGISLRFTLYSLDGHISTFPLGLAHNTKCPSAHHLQNTHVREHHTELKHTLTTSQQNISKQT